MQILQSLGINQSFFVVLGIFMGTYVLLSFLCLNKLAVFLHEREHRIDGREKESEKLHEDVKQIELKLAASRREAQAEASLAFTELKSKAVDQQRNILGAAREQGATELRGLREDLARQLQTEIRKVEKDIPILSRQILDQILKDSPTKARSSGILESEA